MISNLFFRTNTNSAYAKKKILTIEQRKEIKYDTEANGFNISHARYSTQHPFSDSQTISVKGLTV